MSWLGLNGSSREDFASLTDAYNSMYQAAKEADEVTEEPTEEPQELSEERYKKQRPLNAYPANLRARTMGMSSAERDKHFEKYDAANPRVKTVEETQPIDEMELLNSLQDAYAMMYEKKKDSDKCGDDTYWDKEEKKCKSKKKKSGTTVVVGRGGIYGPGYHGGGGSNGGDGETDGGDTEGGTEGGGDGGGGGE